ncbi:MAG: hypothetical protein CSA62_01960 [Planctomycetota bacterium]|nr:MAG: hypothetical protein CSA62_01960 [Planctomycetota bacterium]
MKQTRSRSLFPSIAIPAFLAATLLACDAPAPKSGPSESIAPARAPADSGLIQIQGSTVLRLSGSDRERGRQEGYLRAAALQELFDGWALKLVPKFSWSSFVRPLLHRRFDFPEWAKQRAEGLIEGMRKAGARYLKSERLGREFEAKDFLAISALIDAPGMLCSSFAVWGDKVQGGGPIVARNLDYKSNPSMLRNVIVIVEDAGPERCATVSIGWSSLGITTGISAAGSFVSIHDVPQRIAKSDGHLPRILALQELLRSFRPEKESPADARDKLEKYNYAYGGNAMLAWRHNERRGAVVLEFGPAKAASAKVTLRKPKDAPWIACTNHFRDRKGPRACNRYLSISKGVTSALAEEQKLTPQSVWNIVASARVAATLHTVMFDFGSKELVVDFRIHPQRNKWRRLQVSLRELIGHQ